MDKNVQNFVKTTKFWRNNTQIKCFCPLEKVFHKKNAHK